MNSPESWGTVINALGPTTLIIAPLVATLLVVLIFVVGLIVAVAGIKRLGINGIAPAMLNVGAEIRRLGDLVEKLEERFESFPPSRISRPSPEGEPGAAASTPPTSKRQSNKR